MKPSAIEYLACPYCKSLLTLKVGGRSGEDILTGELSCKICNKSYRIDDGLPDLVLRKELKLSNRISAFFYDIYAPLYDRLEGFLADKVVGVSEEEIREEVVGRLGIGESDIVLEVAIGTGGNIPIIRKYTKKPIFGVDISEGMLKQCLNKVRSHGWEVELFLGNAEYLPFLSDKFDALLNFGGITYFGDKEKALSEMYRVVKPGSRIVVCEQVTLFEKILGKDKPPLELVPKEAVNVEAEYIFNGHFYIMSFEKP